MTEFADGTQELLDAVDELAAAMKVKILANRHKSGLADCAYDYLFDRIIDEHDELAVAMAARGGPAFALDEVLREAADVANFALFIFVKARREMGGALVVRDEVRPELRRLRLLEEALRQVTWYHHDDYRYCQPCHRALQTFGLLPSGLEEGEAT